MRPRRGRAARLRPAEGHALDLDHRVALRHVGAGGVVGVEGEDELHPLVGEGAQRLERGAQHVARVLPRRAREAAWAVRSLKAYACATDLALPDRSRAAAWAL